MFVFLLYRWKRKQQRDKFVKKRERREEKKEERNKKSNSRKREEKGVITETVGHLDDGHLAGALGLQDVLVRDHQGDANVKSVNY